MASPRNRKMKTASPKGRPARRTSSRGSWFELVVLLFMAGTLYLAGSLLGISWTGIRGRMLGEYLRTTWGGALLVPVAFLFYICVAWITGKQIPRPLGQIVGTLQLYFTTAFALGLIRYVDLTLPWVWGEPGHVGRGLARFFVLNLGAPGTVIVAFLSLALSAILFGFRMPVRFFRSASRRFATEGMPRESWEKRPDIRTLRREFRHDGETPSFTVRTRPKIAGEDLIPTISAPSPLTTEERDAVLASTPVDGLVIVGEEVIDSTTWDTPESETP
ncbi:MAG: DNA translocase FtsK 4TM domain-containing protein, partial [Synergistaceae bacterium]|nr:DNA translocase FtsK 4TM domain-containing protein [Synergistaceae bacterium]